MRDAFNWTWIEPIWIAGSIPTCAEDIESLKSIGVKAILTLTRRNLDCDGMSQSLTGIEHLHCPIPDGGVPDTLTWVKAHQFLEAHKDVLTYVHCRMGHGRTGEILISYFMLCRHMSQGDAQAKLAVRSNYAGNAGSLSVPEQRAWIEALAKEHINVD